MAVAKVGFWAAELFHHYASRSSYFSGRRAVGLLRGPPVERDDPQCYDRLLLAEW